MPPRRQAPGLRPKRAVRATAKRTVPSATTANPPSEPPQTSPTQATIPRPKRAGRATAKRSIPSATAAHSPVKKRYVRDVVPDEMKTTVSETETESSDRSAAEAEQSLAKKETGVEVQFAGSEDGICMVNTEQEEKIESPKCESLSKESGAGIGGAVAETVEKGSEKNVVVKTKKVKVVKKVVKKRVAKEVVPMGIFGCLNKGSEEEQGIMGYCGEKVDTNCSVSMGAIENIESEVCVPMGVRNSSPVVTVNVEEAENGNMGVSDSVKVENRGEIEVCGGEKESGMGGGGLEARKNEPVVEAQVARSQDEIYMENTEPEENISSPKCEGLERESGTGIGGLVAENVEKGSGEGSVVVRKKKVKVVKKVVKKRVVKKVVPMDVFGCLNKELKEERGIIGYCGEKVDTDGSVPMEVVENTESEVCVPMGVQNSSPDVTVNVEEAENGNMGVHDLIGVENPREIEVCGEEKEGGMGEGGLEAQKNEVAVEKSDFVGEILVEVSDGDLVGDRKDESGFEIVEVSSGDDEGVKRGLGKSEMGSKGTVLSGELDPLERRKRRKTEIFIGGLDKDTKEEDIRKTFEEVGEVVEVRLMVNGWTGKNHGYAFVRFVSAADAKKALEKYPKVEICGKQCGTAPVKGNDTLFLGNIDKKWKNEDVIKLLKEFGIEKIDKVTVMADPTNIERNRGFAFLELETNKDAQNAYKKLQQKDFVEKLQKIKVAWAEPLDEPDEEAMLKVKSVYAEYLPSSWDEDKVRSHFKKFGEIESVVLARNLYSSRRKDFAFINFTTREAALACIESLNHELLSDEGSKVNVRVSLAKPVPKGKPNRKVFNSISKEIPKQKPKAIQRVVKQNELRNKGIFTRNNIEDRRGERGSSTTGILQHFREQAPWRQPQARLAIGSTNRDYSYSLPGAKRSFPALVDDPYHSYARGHPRARLESSFPAVSPSYSEFSQGVGMTSLPYHQQQGAHYTAGYGYTDHAHSFQRGEAPYHGSSGSYHYHRY